MEYQDENSLGGASPDPGPAPGPAAPGAERSPAGERPPSCSPRFPAGPAASGGARVAPTGCWALEGSVGAELERALSPCLSLAPGFLSRGAVGRGNGGSPAPPVTPLSCPLSA